MIAATNIALAVLLTRYVAAGRHRAAAWCSPTPAPTWSARWLVLPAAARARRARDPGLVRFLVRLLIAAGVGRPGRVGRCARLGMRRRLADSEGERQRGRRRWSSARRPGRRRGVPRAGPADADRRGDRGHGQAGHRSAAAPAREPPARNMGPEPDADRTQTAQTEQTQARRDVAEHTDRTGDRARRTVHPRGPARRDRAARASGAPPTATLARSVAVHVLPDSDPRADALLTAARTSALVSDAHLLRVLDAATEDGVVYVVNEWGSGVSLDRLLVGGPAVRRARAAWVVKEVAEAIATAHRNGVAHGRLLPENVMVTESGSVKLIGFVVDAVLRPRPDAHPQAGSPAATRSSAHESDVLNLAGLLYAALVGRWPGTEGSTTPGRPRRARPAAAPAPGPRRRTPAAGRDLRAGPRRATRTTQSCRSRPRTRSTPRSATTSATHRRTAVGDRPGDASTARHAVDRPSGAPARLAPATAPPGARDPERRPQAQRLPVFCDADTGVGWMHAESARGLPLRRPRRDPGRRPPPPPPHAAGRGAGAERPLLDPRSAAPAAGPTADRRRDPDSSSRPHRWPRAPARTSERRHRRQPAPAWGPDAEDGRRRPRGRRAGTDDGAAAATGCGSPSRSRSSGPGGRRCPRLQPRPRHGHAPRRPADHDGSPRDHARHGAEAGADRRGPRLRPAGRPARGEPRPGRRSPSTATPAPPGGPAPTTTRLGAEERRRPAGRPRRAREGQRRPAHPARQPDRGRPTDLEILAAPEDADRSDRAPTAWTQVATADGRRHAGRPRARRDRSPPGGWWSGSPSSRPSPAASRAGSRRSPSAHDRPGLEADGRRARTTGRCSRRTSPATPRRSGRCSPGTATGSGRWRCAPPATRRTPPTRSRTR